VVGGALTLAMFGGLVVEMGTNGSATESNPPIIERFAGVGQGPGSAKQMMLDNGKVHGMAVVGNTVYLAFGGVVAVDMNAGTAQRIAGGGGEYSFDIPAADASLEPRGIAARAGAVYVTVGNNVGRIDVSSGVLTNFAGTSSGDSGYSGDGGIATTARLTSPSALAFDAAGNLFVLDNGNQHVRRIDATTHVITSIGDDGAGGPANVGVPGGMAVDAAGNVFVTNDQIVQKIDGSTGSVATVAGDGTQCADSTQACGDGGAATSAQLHDPGALALDSSTLYMADTGDHRVRAVELAGGPPTISTVAGSGSNCDDPAPCGDNGAATSAAMSDLSALGVDGSGHVLVAHEALVSSVTPGGSIHWFAGADPYSGLALLSSSFPVLDYMAYPFGLAVGPDGSVYENSGLAVIKITPDGMGTGFAGGGAPYFCVDETQPCGDGGPANQAQIAPGQLGRVAVGPDGSVYFGTEHKIRKVDTHGIISTFAGDGTDCADQTQPCGDGGPATTAQLHRPAGLAFDAAGDFFLADSTRVRRIDTHGVISTVAGSGASCPSSPQSCGDGGPATAAQLQSYALAVDGDGNVFIGDTSTDRIRRVDAHTAVITSIAGGGSSLEDNVPATDAGLETPLSLTFDPGGNLIVDEAHCGSRIRRIEGDGNITTIAGRLNTAGDAIGCGWTGDGGPATSARLGPVYDMAVGSDGTLYLADVTNLAIRRVTGLHAPSHTTATTTTTTAAPDTTTPHPPPAPDAPAGSGLWVAGTDGSVSGVGGSSSLGSLTAPLNGPITHLESTASGNGYWLVGADGGVFAFGDAGFHGSMAQTPLRLPVVSLAGSPSSDGYWLLGSDGGVFAFGDAGFHGSMAGAALRAPMSGIASTQSGGGYWLTAADGGVFAFGDAQFFGSLAGTVLRAPIVGIAATPTGHGYWLVAADGGVFAFGDAQFFGSMAGHRLNKPVTAIVPTTSGHGYHLLASDGGVFAFGDVS